MKHLQVQKEKTVGTQKAPSYTHQLPCPPQKGNHNPTTMVIPFLLFFIVLPSKYATPNTTVFLNFIYIEPYSMYSFMSGYLY